MIQVGTGGFGAAWCREFLSPSVRDRRVKVVAAVDLEPAALQNAQRYLRLPPERCYTDPERAFAENPADFCTVVIPPAAHEAVVDLALRHELDILSEKPIADTLEASVRIAQTGRKKDGRHDEQPLRPGQGNAPARATIRPLWPGRLPRAAPHLQLPDLRELGSVPARNQQPTAH